MGYGDYVGHEKYKCYGGYVDYEKYKYYGGYVDYENRGGRVSVHNVYIIVIRRFTKIGVQKPSFHLNSQENSINQAHTTPLTTLLSPRYC